LLATFLLLAVWMIALRWQLRTEPLDRDISAYAVIGRELLAGRPLYADLWDHKPPAIHLVFAAATAAVGPGAPAVLAVNVTGSLLVLGGLMVAGRRLGGAEGSVAAGLLWALAGGDIGLEANQPNTELLVNACVAWAVAASLNRDPTASARTSWSLGVLTGVAVLLKPLALLPMALLAAVHSLERGGSDGVRPAVSRTILWAVGTAIPVVPTISWAVARAGAGPVWEALIRYNLAYSTGGPAANLVGLGRIGSHLPPGSLTVLAILSALAVAGATKTSPPARYRLVAVVAGSIIAVAAPGRFYPHYYQLLLLPLVLAASTGLAAAVRAGTVGRTFAAASVLWIAGIQLPVIAMDPDSVSRRKYGEVFVVESHLAEQLAAVVTPGEPFFQLGPQPGLYLQTLTVPASGVVYDYPLLPGSPLRDELAARVIAALEETRPRFIVVRTRGAGRGVLPWIGRHYHRTEIERKLPGYEIWMIEPPPPPTAPIDAQDSITVDGFEDGTTSGWATHGATVDSPAPTSDPGR
jgi:hypothetical protein